MIRKRIRTALNLVAFATTAALVIWIVIATLWLLRGIPPGDLLVSSGTILACLMVPAFAITYARFVEDLMRGATTEPEGPGRVDKVRWITSTLWRYWKVGATSGAVQGGYLVGVGFVVVILTRLLLRRITLPVALLFSAGPIALLTCLAFVTQPRAGKWRVFERMRDQEGV